MDDTAKTYKQLTLASNPETVCIQGYENRRTQFPVYASASYREFPVIPADEPMSLLDDLACMVTENIGAIIHGQSNSLMDRYYEIEFHFRGNMNTPDTGSIYKFDIEPYFEQQKIISYGLNFDAYDQLLQFSVIYNTGCVTIFNVDKTDYKLKRITTVA